MRHDDVHWAALRATAKVALSLTVFGCGSSVSVAEKEGAGGSGAGTPHGGASTTSQTTASQGGAPTTQSAGGTVPAACTPSNPGDQVTLDPGTFGCCVDYLGEQAEADWAMPSTKLTACCYEVVGQIDLDGSLLASVDAALVAPTWPADDALSCCDVLGNPCTEPCGCIVWGPPMPVALRDYLWWSLDMLEAA